MRLRLRLLFLILKALWRKPSKTLVESVLSLRVLPNDVDITKITVDRYFALMDLGRMDLAFRLGLLKTMLKRKWGPLATFCTIRYRHPLRLFQRYRLRTRIICWDDHTFYFRHDFERKGRILATGYVCATLLGTKGPVAPRDILAEIGYPADSPGKPEIVSKLQEMDETIHQWQRGEHPKM